MALNQTQIATLGGLMRHAMHGSDDLALAGQRGLLARFKAEVDPDDDLSEDERERRAELARRAHMLRLAARSAESRRGKTSMKPSIPSPPVERPWPKRAANGTWWFKVTAGTSETGRRRQAVRKGFATREQAEQALKDIADAVRAGTYVDRKPEQRTEKQRFNGLAAAAVPDDSGEPAVVVAPLQIFAVKRCVGRPYLVVDLKGFGRLSLSLSDQKARDLAESLLAAADAPTPTWQEDPLNPQLQRELPEQ